MSTIKKLSEYMQYIEDLPSEFVLSRGQTKDRDLLPSALRNDGEGKRKYTKRVIGNFLEEFKANAYQYMKNPWDVKNETEWMLHAQHYGLPTRLMDFTTSHITSLLFSLERSFQNGYADHPVVYFINPYELNLKNKNQRKILNISDLQNHNDDHAGPYVIQGRKINTRINAQKGMFVLFDDDDKALNLSCGENILRKIIIEPESCKKILSSLYSMGIGFSHVYPELSSVSKDIVLQQDINDYLREE